MDVKKDNKAEQQALLKGIKEGNSQVDKNALKDVLKRIFALSNVRINEEKRSANS